MLSPFIPQRPSPASHQTTAMLPGQSRTNGGEAWSGSGLLADQTTKTRPVADHRQRGSALVLSIVTIVMLVMLGAAYLSVARTDRRTAAAVDTRSNQSDASILRYIGRILAGDIPQQLGDGDLEYYDYAWSNPASPWTVPDQFAPTLVPGPVPNLNNGDQPAREPRANSAVNDAAGRTQAQGGENDDPWLASTEPTFPGGLWDHITNLSGVFLDMNDIAPANDLVQGGTRPMPAQYLSTADNNGFSGDTLAVPAAPMGTLSTAQLGVFADADGDGIADSRWTWAPLPSDGGQAYIMAVRLVDNSALLNLNALSFRRPSIATAGFEPRWLWPGELDLDTPLEQLKFNAGLGSVLSSDVLGNTAAAGGRNMAGDSFEDRLDHWVDLVGLDYNDWDIIGTELEQASIGGAPLDDPTDINRTYEFYNTRAEELEMRWRDGLNRADDNVNDNPSTNMEGLDPVLFRDPNKHPSSGLGAGQAETTYDQSGYATIQTFFENEPRKHITVINGAANFAQTDLNTSTTAELADAIEDPLDFSAPGTTPALYLNGGWTTATNFADQFAAILTDFRDDDSEVTFRNNQFGMEYLPFVSEVYVQARFTETATVLATAPSISGNDEVSWEHTPGDYAAAIELINPWPIRIPMPDVELFVDDGTATDPQSWGTLANLFPGKQFFEPYEIVLVRREDTGFDNGQLPTATTSADVTTTAPDWPTGLLNAEVRLEVQTNVGTRVAYQKFRAQGIDPLTYIDEYTAGTADAQTPNGVGYLQLHAVGTGNGLAMLTVRDEDVDLTDLPPINPNIIGGSIAIEPETAQNIAATSSFDTYAKGATSPASADMLDGRVADAPTAADPLPATFAANSEPWIIGNAGRFYRVGDILRAVLIAPRIDPAAGAPITTVDHLTVAEVWRDYFFTNSGSYTVGSAMLNPTDTAVVLPPPSNLNISHAEYFLAAFSNLESNKGLIPGRININTMPQRLLATIFPTTNTGTATTLAGDIVAARTAPDTNINRTAGTRGIQFISQLSQTTTVFDPTGNTSGEVRDFYEYEPELGLAGAHNDDLFTDDVEEKTMFLNYLNQVASTRSDIFTAYVLVRAYPASDFSANGDANLDGIADATTEYRLIAVFDRSQVTGDGLPRILAVKRFSDP
ncbi:MAG: hypothetical protein AAGA25_09445 [Planctomycetota bacterium]